MKYRGRLSERPAPVEPLKVAMNGTAAAETILP
jgi:hypothetical protein